MPSNNWYMQEEFLNRPLDRGRSGRGFKCSAPGQASLPRALPRKLSTSSGEDCAVGGRIEEGCMPVGILSVMVSD
jgi:hypothetical protein